MKVCGLSRRTFSPLDRAFGRSGPGMLVAELGKPWRARDRVERHEADIVAIVAILSAGIAEADKEMHRVISGNGRGGPEAALELLVRHRGSGDYSAWARLRRRLQLRPSSPADLRADGATMVAIVRSSSWLWSAAPAGSLIDEMWMESPISRPVRSTVDFLGDVVGINGQVERVVHDVEHATALEARAGFFVDEVDVHLDVELGALADAQEVHMQREVLDRIELVVARDHAVLVAVDIERR